ncbi:MAG: glycoside hydrolase family 88 protein [Chloroflexi bacterium]|nr:glycoside hydrolase family 88 protein [Chloroflexota bacterium]
MDRYSDYQAAIGRGVAWLLEEQRSDGSFSAPDEGVDSFYKIPYAFGVTGQAPAAQRLLDWVACHCFTAEGDLRSPARKSQGDFHREFYTYANSWLVIGCQRLGRFDLAYRGLGFILRFQDPRTGGFFAEPDFLAAGRGRQDIVCASQGGLACLYLGQLEAARRAGEFLLELIGLQPEPERRLYATLDPAEGLVTRYPEDKALRHVVDAASPTQWYFYPGIAMGFLGQLYRATGERHYLEAAARYFAFTTRCQGDVYQTPPSGKIGWGASVLYAITGEPHYRQAAEEVGDYLVGSQQPGGWWQSPTSDPALRYIWHDFTAEFVVWLSEIVQNLAYRG